MLFDQPLLLSVGSRAIRAFTGPFLQPRVYQAEYTIRGRLIIEHEEDKLQRIENLEILEKEAPPVSYTEAGERQEARNQARYRLCR